MNPILVPIVPIVAQYLSPSFCSLCCASSLTDNSHIVKPPKIGMLPPCVGLDCSRAGCVGGNCRTVFSHAGSVHKSVLQSLDHQCASVQLVSVIPTRIRPLCVFLTGLCFLRVSVLLHLVNPSFPFLLCCLPFLSFLFLPLPLYLFALAFVQCWACFWLYRPC